MTEEELKIIEMEEKRKELFNDLKIMYKATLLGILILSILALVNLF